MNARWWEWVNDGWVKLTCKPGQVLSWREARQEEDRSPWGADWTVEDGLLHVKNVGEAADQDPDTFAPHVAKLGELAAEPAWREHAITVRGLGRTRTWGYVVWDSESDLDGRVLWQAATEAQCWRWLAEERAKPRRPRWTLKDRGQRDYSAEAAGY